jgi:hypothetical protein
MTNDTDKLEDEASNLMVRLFDNQEISITMVQWAAANTDNPKKSTDIRAAKEFSKYHSPKINRVESTHQLIFGVCVCLGTNSHGPWINHDHTQQVMVADGLTINISNAKSTSGDVVNAGTIFCKNPTYTQRVFYLMALQRIIPETTPFFDIGIMQTTSTGQNIPHIIVRCGTNHVETLTEIWMAAKTALRSLMGNKCIHSMLQEEITNTYTTHQAYVQSIQRLPLHPNIVNIDRLRKENTRQMDVQMNARLVSGWRHLAPQKDIP